MGLSNFIQKIKNSFKTVPFDPSCFDHPTANKVSWSPQKRGGSNFKTRKLTTVSSTKLVYKASKVMILFGGIFIVFPMFFIFPLFFNSDSISINFFEFIPFLIPFIFPIVGILLIYYFNRPIVIDKQLGYLYKSYKKPINGLNIAKGKNWVALKDVVALQLLSERVSSKNSSYTSYEINLVFEDASRYNVVDHGKLSSIEDDSKVISEFLGVPVWNKMTSETYTPSIKKEVSDNTYDSTGRYDDEPFVDLNKDKEVDLDEPYDSLKRRKM